MIISRISRFLRILLIISIAIIAPLNNAYANCGNAGDTIKGTLFGSAIGSSVAGAIGMAVLGPLGPFAALGGAIYGAVLGTIWNNICIEYPSGYRSCEVLAEENQWTRLDYEKCVLDKDIVVDKLLAPDHPPFFYGKEYMPERFGNMYIQYGYPGMEETTEIEIDSCSLVVPGSSILSALLLLPPVYVCVDSVGDQACAKVKSVYPPMYLGCHFTEPPAQLRSMCLDPKNGHRVYGFQTVTDINGNVTQEAIRDPAQQHLADPPGCPVDYPVSCFTYWRWDKLLPKNNDVQNMNGHPFKKCITNAPNKGPCVETSYESTTPTAELSAYCQKKIPTMNDPYLDGASCGDLNMLSPNGIYFLGESNMTGNFIMSDYHFSAPLVQCITDTMSNTLKSVDIFKATKDYPAGMTKFQVIQSALKKAVSVSLVLFIVLYSVKVTLSHEIPKKGELFMAMMKFLFVLYFAAGSGIQDYYEALIKFSSWLGGVILEGAKNNNLGGLCNQLELIQSGRLLDPDHIGFWDTLDCRLVSYMGYDGGKHQFFVMGFTCLAMIFAMPPFFGWIVFLMLVIVIFLLFSFIVQYMIIYVAATAAIVLTLFIGPLIIPMMLFTVTAQIFKSYVKEVLKYSLYPVVMFAFLALVMSVFDSVFYGDSVFSPAGYMIYDQDYEPVDDQGKVINPPPKAGDRDANGDLILQKCDTDGIACVLGDMVDNRILELPTLIGPNIPIVWIWGEFFNLILSLLKLMAVLYIFSEMNEKLPEIVSEFTGNFQTDLGKMAPNLFNKAFDMAKSYVMKKANIASGGAAQQAKSQLKKLTGD